MKAFPYDLVGPIGSAATLGLIVLQSDLTIEHDFRRLFADPGFALYVSRVPSGDEVTPETLTAMREQLPRAASLLPPSARFDVIGYGCTSASTLIGPDAVRRLVRQGAQTKAVANPLSAALAALGRVQARRVALVTPYIESVVAPMRAAFEAGGIAVPATLSFGEEKEENVARISPDSIKAAALHVGGGPDVDAVFLSCTNLRTLDIIDDLEMRLGKPVLSSNQVLAWQMAEMAGGIALNNPPGKLFRR